jgi:hypothetical protein
MSTLAAAHTISPSERRTTLRLSVDYPASFQTVSAEIKGKLADISPRGAKFRLANPPKPGTTGRLKIDEDEVFCRVAWADDDGCGLAFEHELAIEAVNRVLEDAACSQVPIACANRIPEGRKRAGQLVYQARNASDNDNSYDHDFHDAAPVGGKTLEEQKRDALALMLIVEP